MTIICSQCEYSPCLCSQKRNLFAHIAEVLRLRRYEKNPSDGYLGHKQLSTYLSRAPRQFTFLRIVEHIFLPIKHRPRWGIYYKRRSK